MSRSITLGTLRRVTSIKQDHGVHGHSLQACVLLPVAVTVIVELMMLVDRFREVNVIVV
ncbi:MAG TPA: hypothetical protein VED86_02580 [archaeon]|nr:hypothetical protein [archaeon]